MRIRITTLIVWLATTVTMTAIGRDITVPGDAASLAGALEVAEAGDRVLLAPGQYLGSDLDLVDGVTLLGDPGAPETVVINADGEGRALRAEGIQLARIVGVTITDGRAQGATSYASSGGGLLVSASRVELQNVHFRDNLAAYSGGCVRVSDGHLVAEQCRFIDGIAVKGGGAIDLSYGSQAEIRDCVFRDNTAAWGGAISARTRSSCWIDDSTFRDNQAHGPQELGGAFFADFAAMVAFAGCVLADNKARQGGAARLGDALSSFIGCTLVDNTATESGAAFMVRGGSLNVGHTIVAFNHGAALTGDDATLYVSASDIFGNEGGDWVDDLAAFRAVNDNLELDPLFCDGADLHLQDDSPCAEANSPVGLIGALPAGCGGPGLQLEAFDAEVGWTEVVLTWTVSGEDGHQYRLTGHAVNDPDLPAWTVVHRPEASAGSYVAVDRRYADLSAVRYTLDASAPQEDWFLLGELTLDTVTAVPTSELQLARVYPNPFNPRVTIDFTVGRDCRVAMEIYDIRGQRVRRLTDRTYPAGAHSVTWEGRDDAGRALSTGTYLLRVSGPASTEVQKLILLK